MATIPIVLHTIASHIHQKIPTLRISQHFGDEYYLLFENQYDQALSLAIDRDVVYITEYKHEWAPIINTDVIDAIDLSHPSMLDEITHTIRMTLVEMKIINICSHGVCHHMSPYLDKREACTPIDDNQAHHCRMWLIKYGIRSKIQHYNTNSYSLKHTIENWCGEYISNGAVIKTCQQLGLGVKKGEDHNANIALSENIANKLMSTDYEILEDGIYPANNMSHYRDQLRRGTQKPKKEDMQKCQEFLDKHIPKFITKHPRIKTKFLQLIIPQVSLGSIIEACRTNNLRIQVQDGSKDVKVNLSQRILRVKG